MIWTILIFIGIAVMATCLAILALNGYITMNEENKHDL
jgi:hypothetical protein